jgi:hypothetical protein
MNSRHSSLSLHLHYRVSIAELNLDVNLVRIYRDYLEDASRNADDQLNKEQVEKFQAVLNGYLAEIDDIKNEMHLLKMQLAQGINGKTVFNNSDPEMKTHQGVDGRYQDYRKRFQSSRQDLVSFITGD